MNSIARPRADWRAVARTLPVLFKLRIVGLLLFAAAGGAFLAAGGWPGGRSLILLMVTGGMAASGASALNQYLERESDAHMRRTRSRPLVTGAVRHSAWVPVVGVVLALLPVVAVLPSNPALAFFLLLGAVIYVGVYTVWLKPRTLLNIVIGGAAGSAATLSGGAAVGAWNDPGVVVLALLVFVWTPCHFWSLAILYREDYRRANVPMLPARATLRRSALWVLVHTVATALAALALASLPTLGLLYLAPVGLATLDILRRNFQLVRAPTPAHARSLFLASNIFLAIILAAIILDSTIA